MFCTCVRTFVDEVLFSTYEHGNIHGGYPHKIGKKSRLLPNVFRLTSSVDVHNCIQDNQYSSNSIVEKVVELLC